MAVSTSAAVIVTKHDSTATFVLLLTLPAGSCKGLTKIS